MQHLMQNVNGETEGVEGVSGNSVLSAQFCKPKTVLKRKSINYFQFKAQGVESKGTMVLEHIGLTDLLEGREGRNQGRLARLE